MEGAVTVVAAVLLAYAVVERRLQPTPISGAMIFTAVGLLASEQGTGLITPSGHGHQAAAVLELTLVIVLFTDAMAISGVRWATEAPLPVRLLGLGLPLTMVAGWMLAVPLLPEAGLWGAALLAAVLAPTDSALGLPVITTDSALGLPVITNPRVPHLIRHALNVEGGLNDGLALPFVTIFFGGGVGGGGRGRGRPRPRDVAARRGGLRRDWCRAGHGRGAGAAVVDGQRLVGTALAVGGLAGHGRARLRAGRRHRGQRLHRRLGGRLAAGRVSRGSLAAAQQTPEELANLGISVSFVLFGALFLAPALTEVSWSAVAYALGSLTVIRMVPVAVALLGSRLAPPTVVYIGWFGPRGLASIVFADMVATSGLPSST
jgi:sodium/hydrogen antiporter